MLAFGALPAFPGELEPCSRPAFASKVAQALQIAGREDEPPEHDVF
jgi:hypothetical protein